MKIVEEKKNPIHRVGCGNSGVGIETGVRACAWGRINTPASLHGPATEAGAQVERTSFQVSSRPLGTRPCQVPGARLGTSLWAHFRRGCAICRLSGSQNEGSVRLRRSISGWFPYEHFFVNREASFDSLFSIG